MAAQKCDFDANRRQVCEEIGCDLVEERKYKHHNNNLRDNRPNFPVIQKPP
jgi:hypothetical protein